METKPRRTTKKNTDHFHQFIVIGLVLAIIGIAGLYFYIPYRENWFVSKMSQLVIQNAKLQQKAEAPVVLTVDAMEKEAAVIAYTGFGKILIDGNQKGFLSYLAQAYPNMVAIKTQNTKDVQSAMTMIKNSYGFTKIPHDLLKSAGTIWNKQSDTKISALVPYNSDSGIVHQTFYFIKTNGVWYFDFLN